LVLRAANHSSPDFVNQKLCIVHYYSLSSSDTTQNTDHVPNITVPHIMLITTLIPKASFLVLVPTEENCSVEEEIALPLALPITPPDAPAL
jgi:hypothetical protein